MPEPAAMTREQRIMLKAAAAFSSASEAGGARILRVPEAPESPMLNWAHRLAVVPAWMR